MEPPTKPSTETEAGTGGDAAATADAPDFIATIERHHPDLPVYLIVPGTVAAAFGRDRTFVVEAAINGHRVGRRSIKPWGDGRWFLELTKVQCARLGVGEGDAVTVRVRPAPEVPPALAARITALGLEARWARLSAAERRMLCEHVFAAKKEATQTARIERVVARL